MEVSDLAFTASCLSTYDAKIQQEHSIDMAGTQTLHIKSEVLDTIHTIHCIF